MALHMSTGLHSAHEAVDVVHQKLRKTVSDISSSLRHSSSQELPRRANMDEVSRRGLSEESPKRLGAADETKKPPPAVTTTPAEESSTRTTRPTPEDQHRRNLLEETHRKSTSEETGRKPAALEDMGRKSTIEESPRRQQEDRLNQKDKQRQQTTCGTSLSRAQALYKSESKSSLSETELKVEFRASTGVSKIDQGVILGTMGVPGSGARKVSPLLGHRASVSQRSGIASGTDSSLDSDYSYEYSSHSQTLTPVPVASTPVPSVRGRSEISVGGGGGATMPISVSRDPSLDNVTSSVTSSDSSSQELDSAHATEDSHSSEAADETDAAHHARAMAYSSGCGGSSGGESGYVSPYLSTERGGLVTLGSSLLLTRATIAQYDTKRTITTVVAPKSSFDENRVRIQVPAAAVAAAAAAGGTASRGIMATSAGSIGAEVSVTRTGGQQVQQGGPVGDNIEGAAGGEKATPVYTLRTSDQEASSPPKRLQPEVRSPVAAHVTSPEHPRKPSPNRNPRFV